MEVWGARFRINVGINALCWCLFPEEFQFVMHRCPPYLPLFVTWIECFITCVGHGVSKHNFDAIVMLDLKVVHSTGKFDGNPTQSCVKMIIYAFQSHVLSFAVSLCSCDMEKSPQIPSSVYFVERSMADVDLYHTAYSTSRHEKSVDITDMMNMSTYWTPR